MILGGIQKLTCLDFPGRVACTVFTSGCNFRCPFCHNASLVTPTKSSLCDGQQYLDTEDFFKFLEKRKGLLDGVAITGGEPMLQKDIEDFIARIRDLGYEVKLDTNGSFPDRLQRLIDRHLVNYVAMDIKNSLDKYPATIGLPKNEISASVVNSVMQSVDILKAGAVPFEFRTTVVKSFHDRESFEGIGAMIANTKHYYLQKFVDSGDLLDSETSGFSDEEMYGFLEIVKKYVPSAELRGV